MRISNWLPAGLVAGLAVIAQVAPAQETGSVTGTFVLKGAAPKLPEIKPDKDPQVCAAQPVPNELLIVDPSSKGIANVFIWAHKLDGKDVPASKPTEEKVVIDNKGCTFVPHCVIAQTGQTLVMQNSDAVAHNVHTNPVRGKAINDLVAPNDNKGIERPLEKAEMQPIPVVCDIHPWMKGHMLVIDHPHAVLTDEKGQFTLEGLPPGKYTLRVWHEGGGYAGYRKGIEDVEVTAGKATDLGKKEIDIKDLKNVK